MKNVNSLAFATPSRHPKLEALFLASLFLYPFVVAGHTLYMIPQVLLLAIGFARLPLSSTQGANGRVLVTGLAFLAASIAMARELLADHSQFLEPAKLLINLSTVVLFLFLTPVFQAPTCAKWLKRFAVVWLLVVIAGYVHSQASTWQLVTALVGPEGVTSSHLYEIAEPLAPIFLTKNITSMYAVAVFGAFLYFRRCTSNPATILEKCLFLTLIVLLFSRQGILSGVLVGALDSLVGRERRIGRWAILVLIGTTLVLGTFFAFAFDLNSQQDGATTRLELWRFFFDHWTHFAVDGLGVASLNLSLEHLNIDNYHMFFMNQIAAYGVIHCLAFNILLLMVALRSAPKKIRWLVIAPYWLNVCFQTYGYEYGNLFLLCIAANSWSTVLEFTSPYRAQAFKPLGEALS